MKPEMLELLKDLADVLEKHAASLSYTIDDNGIHVTQGGHWTSSVCIGWPENGDVSEIRAIIQANAGGMARELAAQKPESITDLNG